ncbi:hypothetical protein O6H91_02G099200 [Diphasiastrum complanatum]|uniref:Uncharacterized protein n=1 Tax=Diphasiastrum complanatum TaxID=34168 RepID=A0ACC2EIR4_DIPCM|nr:hypothetical protein O6H91_02G099200 [Diphasiastrum complanatum]
MPKSKTTSTENSNKCYKFQPPNLMSDFIGRKKKNTTTEQSTIPKLLKSNSVFLRWKSSSKLHTKYPRQESLRSIDRLDGLSRSLVSSCFQPQSTNLYTIKADS